MIRLEKMFNNNNNNKNNNNDKDNLRNITIITTIQHFFKVFLKMQCKILVEHSKITKMINRMTKQF